MGRRYFCDRCGADTNVVFECRAVIQGTAGTLVELCGRCKLYFEHALDRLPTEGKP